MSRSVSIRSPNESLDSHAAIQVPPRDLEAYPAEWDASPYLGSAGYLPHPSPRRGYAAMVSRRDSEVGRLLELLEELELVEDTIRRTELEQFGERA